MSAFAVHWDVAWKQRTSALLSRLGIDVGHGAANAAPVAAAAAAAPRRLDCFVPVKELYHNTMFGEFDQSPAYSAISGAVGEYLNDNMAGKDMGFSMSDRISKAMERAVGMGSTIDKYIDSALDDYNGTFGATHGNLLDCKISRGTDFRDGEGGLLPSLCICFRITSLVNGAADITTWHGVWYHPFYAMTHLTMNDVSTKAAFIEAQRTLGCALDPRIDYPLAHAHNYCALAVQLRKGTPDIIWHLFRISELCCTGQVSFGAPTGLRSLAILHTAAPGFDGIIAFRQVPCAFASPVTDRLLSRYGREQIHDAELLVALDLSDDFNGVAIFPEGGTKAMTAGHVSTLKALLLFKTAGGLAMNFHKLLELAGFPADEVDYARRRLQDGPPPGLFENWYRAPDILRGPDGYTSARFFNALKKQVLTRHAAEPGAASGAGAFSGAAAGSSAAHGFSSPAKRNKTGTGAAGNVGANMPPAGAGAAHALAAGHALAGQGAPEGPGISTLLQTKGRLDEGDKKPGRAPRG